MKTSFSLLAALALTSSAFAQSSIPGGISYQGFLTDNNGAVVGQGTPEDRILDFRIYRQAVGGVPIWGGRQTVSVFDGNFSVVLGNGVALSGVGLSGADGLETALNSVGGSEYYFSITPVGGPEFTPRQQLLASAFAHRAKVAETAGNAAFADVARNVNQTSGTATFNKVSFGNRLDQHLSLWDPNYGMGVQASRLYQRSGEGFEWFKGGSHSDNTGNPGSGGVRQASLETNGDFHLYQGNLRLSRGGVFLQTASIDNSGLIDHGNRHKNWIRSFNGAHSLSTTSNFTRLKGPNIALEGQLSTLNCGSSTRHLLEAFNGTHALGVQAGTTYLRSSFNFSFHKGGSPVGGQASPGPGGTQLVYMDTTGIVHVGSVRGFSDKNLKKDFADLNDSKSKLMQLKPMKYRFKSDEEGRPMSYGFVAQDVREIFPDFVQEMPDGTLTLAYDHFIPVAIDVIQEQESELKALRKKVADLESTTQSFESRLKALEAAKN